MASSPATLDVKAAYKPQVLLPPLLLAIFMRALQMTVIAPSLINIAQSIGASLADVGWIMSIYATGSLIAQPIAGRFSDARSRRSVFIVTVVVFATGSIACALSKSLWVLVAGRLIQSLGAGGIQPAAIALIGQRAPQERQNAALYAVYGMFALAGAIGAVIGGVLIDGGKALASHVLLTPWLHGELAVFPWHLIFWINLPLAAATLILATRIAPDASAREKVGVDAGAVICIGLTALCLMFAASGNASAALAWVAAAIGCVAILAFWEKRARFPFIDPALFAQREPALLYALALITGVPIFSVTMYSAAYYIAQFHASAATSGVALLALALPLGAAQGVGARLARRHGARLLLAAGILSLACGELALGLLQSVPGVLLAFALSGFGMGLASAPPNALLLRCVRAERSGAATGVLTMMSGTGAIAAPAVMTAFLHYSGAPLPQSFRSEFLLSFVILIASLPLVALLREQQLKTRTASS